MTALPGLQVSLLSPRVLELTPGSYGDLVQSTLGNVATASDGTDALIDEAAAIEAALEADFPNLDLDVSELGDLSDLADLSDVDLIDASIFLAEVFMQGVALGIGALSSLLSTIGF